MHNINGVANQLFLKWYTLQRCKNTTNQSTDSTEGQEIEDTRQHKRSDKVT